MTWRELRAVAIQELAVAGVGPAETEARFIVERASGYDAGEWPEIADAAPPARAEQELRDMVRRRVAGEPLQYVLGGWAFRGLDLFVDRRVLIPRPETERVVDVALAELSRLGAEPPTVTDLGTGHQGCGGAPDIARLQAVTPCRFQVHRHLDVRHFDNQLLVQVDEAGDAHEWIWLHRRGRHEPPVVRVWRRCAGSL